MAISGVNNAGVNPVSAAHQTNQVQRTNFKPDIEKVESIRSEQRQWIESQQQIMKQLNAQIIGLTLSNAQQGNNNTQNNNLFNLARMSKMSDAAGMQDYFSMFILDGKGNFAVDFSGVSPEMQQQLISKAQEDVSDNGFWGVKQTSERIFNFAEALTGGDPAKMEKMQQVAERAFADVAKIFGGMDKMPEISRQTLDAVRQLFDDFAAATEANKQTSGLEGVIT